VGLFYGYPRAFNAEKDPMSDPVIPPTPAADPGDNATIKAMREQIDAANKAAKDAADARAVAEKALQDIERAKLEENDRLKLELADAKAASADAATLRDELGRYQSTLQTQYEAELAAVPEEKRAQVASLSSAGSWPDRVKALQTAKSLLGAPPASAGTITNPGGITPPATPPPAKIDLKNPPSLADAYATTRG
jgi:hypothetical protein